MSLFFYLRCQFKPPCTLFLLGSILLPHLLYFNDIYPLYLALFFVHSLLALFGSQHYLKVFVLNIHAPTKPSTLDNTHASIWKSRATATATATAANFESP